MIYGIALGSNLGNREAFLQQGLKELFCEKLGHATVEILAIAPLYESDPVDCPPDSQPFLNSAMEVQTELSPIDLLNRLQEVQEKAGRPKVHGFNTPRTLDLDILYVEGATHQEERLQLPHPRMHLRRFVLEPLNAIAPQRLIQFPQGKTLSIETLYQQLESTEKPLSLVKSHWFEA